MSVYELDQETNQIFKQILDAAFYIHTKLGPGLLEKVYEESLAHVLMSKGLKVEKQKALPVILDGMRVESGYRIDLLIEDRVIIEVKSCESIAPIHHAQLQTYLKLSQKTLGLILNFNVLSLKDGIKRIAMSQNQKENFV